MNLYDHDLIRPVVSFFDGVQLAKRSHLRGGNRIGVHSARRRESSWSGGAAPSAVQGRGRDRGRDRDSLLGIAVAVRLD